jgi:hypothetical protein
MRVTHGLQRDRGTEKCHDAVTGEFVDDAAVVLHHAHTTLEQVGHDFAEAFRAERSGDVH